MSEEKKKSLKGVILLVVVAVVVFLLGLLTSSIMERRAESVAKLKVATDLPEWETRNEVWGKHYPKEFESYLKMADTNFRSMYAGSATVDYLENSPELVVMWAGYGFSKDYLQARGHSYAVTDVRNTLRTGGVDNSPMPATCWSCKSPDVPRLMSEIGVAEFYKGKWIDKGAEIINPIGCGDCHDPKTMNLTITRPALIEAMERRGKKIEDFTHQEMRSLVCAQCHVEYYFKGPDKYLTFPWDKGFSADSMEAYYDEIDFKDWTHKLSKTKMLKAQHPDYELFMTGIHAQRGVACADCHMPYNVEGGVKFTDHHIQSPLNNIANSCQVCHRESEAELTKNVNDIQQRVMEIRRIVEKSIAKAHLEAEYAWKSGATEEEMEPVLALIRSAQWRWDWVAAANSVGFHSPVEALRVLGTSIERSEKARGQLAVIATKHNLNLPIPLPDVSTKSKAQEYIGLKMEELRKDKEKLRETVFPDWEKKAKARQGEIYKY
jgi:nitrite reductase (cytochrome c-552)